MHRRNAFTLIELLIVISIITLLLSILMPSMTAAREQARTVLCKNSLRIVHMAFSSYAQENNGYWIAPWDPYDSLDNYNPAATWYKQWPYQMSYYLNEKRPPGNARGGTLNRYWWNPSNREYDLREHPYEGIGKAEGMWCPSLMMSGEGWPDHLPESKQYTSWSYAILAKGRTNRYDFTGYPRPDRFVHPATTIHMMDYSGTEDGRNIWVDYTGVSAPNEINYTYQTRNTDPHLGKSNYLMATGNAVLMSHEDVNEAMFRGEE